MENAANHSPDPGMARRSSSLPGPRPTDPENLPVNSRTNLIQKAVQPAGIPKFSVGITGTVSLADTEEKFIPSIEPTHL